MPKTITIINMGSGKSWSGTKSQIWAQLFLDIAAQELPGCRCEKNWDLGKVSPSPTLTVPPGFQTPRRFFWTGAIENVIPPHGAGAADYVQLNDGPSGTGVGVTKIRNSIQTAITKMATGDTVNIVGHSRGGWVAWPQAELIAASGKAVQINMYLIDPVRRAFSRTYSGADAWMSQYSQWGVTTSATSTQIENVSAGVHGRLSQVEVMYMSNTTSNFPKLELNFGAAGRPGGLHCWVLPGKHGSATNSETNPYLTNFTLWLFERFLYRNGTAFKNRIRFKTAAALDDAFIRVRIEHQINATMMRVWDPAVERVQSVLPNVLVPRLGIDEQYNLFPPVPTAALAPAPPSIWSRW